jgi:hypothetical protein
MNSIMFMPSIMPHCGGCGSDTEGFLVMLLTFFVTGVILFLFGIFVNILSIKFSNRFEYTPMSWHDIKPTEDNSFLGFLGGIFGLAFTGASIIIGLVSGVGLLIISLL